MGAIRLLKGIRSGIGFLTTLPVGGDGEGFDAFMGHIYIFIIVGVLAGALIGAIACAMAWLLPGAIVPALIVVLIFLVTGINHLDGLSDFGDGLIASGSREKKIVAMKDVHAGAGGVLFIGLDLLLLYAGASLLVGFGGACAFAVLLVAEVCAKASQTTVAAFGRSLHAGMGSMLIEKTRKSHYLLGIVLAIIVCAGAMGLLSLYIGFGIRSLPIVSFVAIAASIAVGLFMVFVADRNFGGVNGDVIGAANEIGRIVALLVAGVLLWMLL